MRFPTLLMLLALAIISSSPATAQPSRPPLEAAWEMCLDAVLTDDMAAALARAAPMAGYREFQPGWFGRMQDGMTIVLFTGDDEFGDPVCGVRNDAIERDVLIARGVAYWRDKGLKTDTSLWFSAVDETRGLYATIHKPNTFFQMSVQKD